ncbi:hypothetical protein OCK74_06435 [Chitinophagaceae bacterium LB-8]|uniref:Uncharacterized protein n=1 Tax=Paraflavisolibacter caeni TaxID=2982496 RepID=A0A9X2XUK3_9BACT|nr:hypothetical protein [Paraflavisolibacter caeni]MCU7548746.1 hypothetical protein [Paraflavisolibacter caeni]
MLLEGYIEFENEIPVALECLGKEFPIVIAGIAGLLAMPLMFQGFNDERKLGPLQSPEQGNVKYKDHFHWGSVHSWPSGDSAIRACKILFNDIDEQSFEKTGNRIAQELQKWRSLLIDNISLMLEKDYRGTRRSLESNNFGFGEFGLFRKKEGSDKEFIPEELKCQVIEVIIENTLDFNVEGIQQVLDATSKGKAPLLPFYFLFDAERARFEKNYRKSILDSATAVEVCFSFLISQLLPFNEDLNKYVASKHNSLRLKRDLLKVLKVSIPVREKEYIEDLDIVRNKVIHAGHIPTVHEAYTAYKIAKETLYALLPKKYEI